MKILDKIDGKFVFPQNQGWGNGAFWLLRGFILDLGGWGFAVPFYSVQDCRYSPLLGAKTEMPPSNYKTKTLAKKLYFTLKQ